MATTPAELFERHHVAIYRYLLRMTGSRETAEELTQDVFVRVLKGLEQYQERDRERAWLFCIASRALELSAGPHFCQDPWMIFGVSPTKDAVVIAQAAGSGKTFAIKSITSIPFQARSGADLRPLLKRLVVIFDRGGKARRSTIALLGSSSGRFKSSVEAIKAEAITELAAAESGLPVVRVTAASLKKVLGCSAGQKWQARAAERFNPRDRHENWSKGAAGATAAAFKVAEHPSS